MEHGNDGRGWALSLVGGGLLWAAVAMLGGTAEPWDAPAYWSAGYPLSLLLAAVVGGVAPVRTWRWALAIVFAQVPVLLAGGAGLGLLPLGLAMLGFLSLPLVLAAWIGARVRGWLIT